MDALCASTARFPTDIFALSEVDVPSGAGPGYLGQWKAKGFKASLSSLENGSSRVAIASRDSLKPVRVCTGPGAPRHAAGIFSVTNEHGASEPLLVVAAYCQAGNPRAADEQLRDLMAGIHRTRCKFVMLTLGDFSMEDSDGAMGELLACGLANLGDACARGQPLPKTGPGRRRRIEYAVCDWRMAPESVTHFDLAESDHLCVSYRFAECFPVPFTKPSRAGPLDVSAEYLETFFSAVSFQGFDVALSGHRLDDAWELLSTVAEQTLCGENPSPPSPTLWPAFASSSPGFALSDIGLGMSPVWIRSFVKQRAEAQLEWEKTVRVKVEAQAWRCLDCLVVLFGPFFSRCLGQRWRCVILTWKAWTFKLLSSRCGACWHRAAMLRGPCLDLGPRHHGPGAKGHGRLSAHHSL